MRKTTRRIIDASGWNNREFRAEQVEKAEAERLRASIAEHVIAKQIARLEAQRQDAQ